MIDPVIPKFMAGFDLYAQRRPDGRLYAYHSTIEGLPCVMDDWPKELVLFEDTYVLEDVVKGKDGYECASYC